MPPKIAAFASRIGLTGLATAILVALLAVQTIRLEGFKVWPINIEGARPKAERLQHTIDEIAAAQKQAAEAARRAKERAEADYRELAERIDNDAERARVGQMDAAERFIAANSVRCPAYRGDGGGTVAPAGDSGSQGGDGPGRTAELATGLVAVPEEDIRVCTRNTSRLIAVREWALELTD